MGTNVIYLDDLASAPSIPAYRRARLRALGPATDCSARVTAAPAPASWVAAAQRRAALRLAAAPVTARPATTLPVQPIDQATVPSASGRTGALRLSGRLVDVCAELERLAQAEALADAMARRA